MKQTIINQVASGLTELMQVYMHYKTLGQTSDCQSLALQISNYNTLLAVAHLISEDCVSESLKLCGEHCSPYRVLLIANNMRLYGVEKVKSMEV